MKKYILPLITIILIAVVVILSYTAKKPIEKFELDDITYEDGVVNVYYFWGDGCPKCSELSRFFNVIEKELGDKYNLYKFEVWNDTENANLLTEVSALMEETVSGVPYVIIGNQTFQGFSSQSEGAIKDAIKEQAEKNDYDVMQIYMNQNKN